MSKNSALSNIQTLYKARSNIIKIFDDYSSIISEATFYASFYGKGHPSDLALGLKILTLKQMLKRLPIALAQVKAGNTSKSY